VPVEELKAALAKDGGPATLPEVKKRFEAYLGKKTRGKDPSKIRIVLE